MYFILNSGSSDEYFISGGDDGAINYWSTKRKKPICVVRNAHGGTWITAISALINSDVFISGAADGFIRVWRPTSDRSRIEQFHKIKAVSFQTSTFLWLLQAHYALYFRLLQLEGGRRVFIARFSPLVRSQHW